MKKKENVGKIVFDNAIKVWDDTKTSSPMDYAYAREEDYIKNLIETVNKHIDIFIGNFYVDVQKKKERLLPNTLPRHFFIAKQACPTPTNDQDLFMYNRKTDSIEYMWSIPDKDTCTYLIENAIRLPDDHKKLLHFVMDYKDGTFLKKAMKLNGELKKVEK